MSGPSALVLPLALAVPLLLGWPNDVLKLVLGRLSVVVVEVIIIMADCLAVVLLLIPLQPLVLVGKFAVAILVLLRVFMFLITYYRLQLNLL